MNVDVKVTDNTKHVKDAAKKAGYRNFAHAAASIRKAVIASITPSDEPSEPGEPPHTRDLGLTKRGRQKVGHLPKSIAFASGPEEAVVGPRGSIIGTSGRAHEFGESHHETNYPARPFMVPGLLENLDRFADQWEGSIS